MTTSEVYRRAAELISKEAEKGYYPGCCIAIANIEPDRVREFWNIFEPSTEESYIYSEGYLSYWLGPLGELYAKDRILALLFMAEMTK